MTQSLRQLLLLACVGAAGQAQAADLLDAWRAAQGADVQYAAARAARLSGGFALVAAALLLPLAALLKRQST
jgi:hypothetical protein